MYRKWKRARKDYSTAMEVVDSWSLDALDLKTCKKRLRRRGDTISITAGASDVRINTSGQTANRGIAVMSTVR